MYLIPLFLVMISPLFPVSGDLPIWKPFPGNKSVDICYGRGRGNHPEVLEIQLLFTLPSAILPCFSYSPFIPFFGGAWGSRFLRLVRIVLASPFDFLESIESFSLGVLSRLQKSIAITSPTLRFGQHYVLKIHFFQWGFTEALEGSEIRCTCSICSLRP